MIEFHNQFVKTSDESLFAVRFIKVESDGTAASPMMPASPVNGQSISNKWDLSAKSAVETYPCDNFESHFSNGIYAVTYKQYKNKTGKWAKMANDINKELYRLVLLEYSTDDVITTSKHEIVLRQCNILFTEAPSVFREKADDGTLENIQKEFKKKKRSFHELSFAMPVERFRRETLSYIMASGIKERRVSHSLALMTMTYASVANRLTGVCDRRRMIWFSLITPMITERYTESDIKEYVYLIRERYLNRMTDENVEKLIQALIFSKFGEGVDSVENRIYYDARLTAKGIVLFKPYDEEQFKTAIFRIMKREGLMAPNELASMKVFDATIGKALKRIANMKIDGQSASKTKEGEIETPKTPESNSNDSKSTEKA